MLIKNIGIFSCIKLLIISDSEVDLLDEILEENLEDLGVGDEGVNQKQPNSKLNYKKKL